jgi:hypothetical protein
MAKGRYGPKGITLEELEKQMARPSCGRASVEPRSDR